MREQTTLANLMDQYEGFLFDAYGVLLRYDGPTPQAAEILGLLKEHSLPFLVVTNDASRSLKSSLKRYNSFGLDIEEHQMLTSGMLINDYFQKHKLIGARTMVLGTKDSEEYAKNAGAELVSLSAESSIDVLVVGDGKGYEFYESIVCALNCAFRAIEEEREVHLILPNPDLIYPLNDKLFGFTAGTVAQMIEEAIPARFPSNKLKFTRLGKPFSPIFEKATEKLGTHKVLMIGDQLLTDIKGANDFGLDSALVSWGVTSTEALCSDLEDLPRYILSSFF